MELPPPFYLYILRFLLIKLIKPVTPYSRRSNLGQGLRAMEHVFSHVEAPTNSPAPARAPELNKKMKSQIPSLKQPPT
jgi:hypothetical protein